MNASPMRRSRRLSFESLESRIALTAHAVSPGGTDTGPGTADHPWRTLQFAANQVQAGDTVTVSAGQYAGFDLQTDGTASQPIVFHGEPGAVINARNLRTPDGINLEGTDYIVIEGFEVSGAPRAGIRSVTNEHVTIRNNRTDSNGRWGIFSGFSDDLLIENNVATRSGAEHGIYVSNSGDRPVIRGNTIWGNHSSGIHMNGDASQGGDGIISGGSVENNAIYDNGSTGSAINADGVQNSIFRNNLIYDNHNSGISLYQIDAAEGAKNNLVVHNTILQAADGRWALNIQDGSTGTTVRNNIFYSADSYRGSISLSDDSGTGFTSDYNAVVNRFTRDDGDSVLSLAAWQAQTGWDQHSRIAALADLFVDPDHDNYRLSSTSPAIDAGTGLAAAGLDHDGRPRPQGAGWDMGAFELPSAVLGDMNGDGVENNLDIAAFALALTDAAAYKAQFPLLDPLAAGDVNGDGRLDNLDIAAFASPLTSG